MKLLTLLVKTSTGIRLKQINSALKSKIKELDAQVKILGAAADGWVRISLEGEDEEVATNYITKELGICPIHFGTIEKFALLKGYITNVQEEKASLSVDIGVFQPKIVLATIPLWHLQAQLVDGREVPMGKIAELFGLRADLPVNIKIDRLIEKDRQIVAKLSTDQTSQYKNWRESFLDRLLILGSTIHEVNITMEKAKLKRDVIGVEPLGMFEHALTCKLGTAAAGLIPQIGRKMKSSKFIVFSPSRIAKFLETDR